jgi:hypothetical protein
VKDADNSEQKPKLKEKASPIKAFKTNEKLQ